MKDFVSYNEALELKELGFDEPCLYHWHNSCKTHPFTNETFNPNCRPKTNSGIKDIGEENHVWSAPTFSQCFRWFREKGYDFNIVKELSDDLVTRVYVYWCGYLGVGIDRSEEYKTYEEAELECLKKLIEIVKKQK